MKIKNPLPKHPHPLRNNNDYAKTVYFNTGNSLPLKAILFRKRNSKRRGLIRAHHSSCTWKGTGRSHKYKTKWWHTFAKRSIKQIFETARDASITTQMSLKSYFHLYESHLFKEEHHVNIMPSATWVDKWRERVSLFRWGSSFFLLFFFFLRVSLFVISYKTTSKDGAANATRKSTEI